MNKPPKLTGKILFIIIIFLCLLSVEVGLRAASYFNGRVLFSELTVDDPLLDWKLAPNYCQKVGAVRVNSKGFRGPEFSNNKNGLIRVIVLGDSCVFGAGASGDEFTLSRLLEKRLNLDLRDSSYEVINAGVPGYTSSQCLLYLKNELLNLSPDTIILYCGWNDIWAYRNPYSNTAAIPFLRSLSRVMSKSLTFTLFRNKILTPIRNKSHYLLRKQVNNAELLIDDHLKKTTLDIFEENLYRMIQIARQNGVKVLILTIPTSVKMSLPDKVKETFSPHDYWREGFKGFMDMYSSVNQVIRNLRLEEGAKIIVVDGEFKRFSDQEIGVLFSDFVHPNDKGYGIIADIVYLSLVKEASFRGEKQ